MKKKLLLFMTAMCLVGCGAKNETLKSTAPNIEETILANKVNVEGNTALYTLDEADMEGIIQSEISRFGNDIMMRYSYYSQEDQTSYTCFRILGIETGEMVYEIKLSEFMDLKVQMIGKKIYAMDWITGKAVEMNEKLEVLKEYQFDWNQFCFGANGKNLIAFTEKDGILVINLETNEEKNIFPDAKKVSVENIDENKITFNYIDENTKLKNAAYLEVESCSVKQLDLNLAMGDVFCSDVNWLANLNLKENKYYLGNDTSGMVFDANMGETVVLCSDTGNIIKFYNDYEQDGMEAMMYDKDGNFISQFAVSGYMYASQEAPVWYEEYEGYILTMINVSGQDQLMFWDTTQDMDGEDLSLYAVEDVMNTKEGTAVDSSLYQKAKELGDQYGVEILIADQCETNFLESASNLCFDPNAINNALKELETAMKAYPEGFFEQLKTGEFNQIEIQLLGNVYKDLLERNPVGFVDLRNGTYVMGLDIQSGLMSVEHIFYHETSHMIDVKLIYEGEYLDTGFSDEQWRAMNPEGFVYTYDSENFESMYSDYPVYFVDEYSTFNSMEDRARIFEYACMGLWKEMGLDDKKYNYYCEGIRKSFDTTGWPEQTLWEGQSK